MNPIETIEREISDKVDSHNEILKWAVREIKERLEYLEERLKDGKTGRAAIEMECLAQSVTRDMAKLKDLDGAIDALMTAKNILKSSTLE